MLKALSSCASFCMFARYLVQVESNNFFHALIQFPVLAHIISAEFPSEQGSDIGRERSTLISRSLNNDKCGESLHIHSIFCWTLLKPLHHPQVLIEPAAGVQQGYILMHPSSCSMPCR
ncbi:hypothetical protein Droror1_Dr00005975 [Drosera rotundifolia]